MGRKASRRTTLSILPLGLLLTANAAPEQPSTPFCNQFFAIADQGYRGFSEFRGTAIDKDEYIVVGRPPGMPSCNIQESRYDYIFYCVWSYRDNEWLTALSEARALRDGIATCLPAAKIDEKPLEEDGATRRWRTYLKMRGKPLHFQISASQRPNDRTAHLAVFVSLLISYER